MGRTLATAIGRRGDDIPTTTATRFFSFSGRTVKYDLECTTAECVALGRIV